MKRSISLFSLILVASILIGCIISKTPNTNDVAMNSGEQKTFSVNVFPFNATYTWILDGETQSNTAKSYVYYAEAGDHTLKVIASHSLGEDIQIWNITCEPLSITFNNTYGGSSRDEASTVQQTSDGGYIMAGHTASYGAGSNDVLLIKIDAYGNKVWDHTFGGGNNDYARGVQQTSDGGYILAGSTDSYGAGITDAWLIKTDANGNKVWDYTFGGTLNDEAYAVQQTSDGGYILAGTTESYGAGMTDAWLIKTDANGNKVWDYTFGGSLTDEAYAVQQTSDGGYIMAGSTYSYGAGMTDAWLIRTDADGNRIWDYTFGGEYTDEAYSVQQTSDGGYVLAGSIGDESGYSDMWLIKADTDGNKVWDHAFGGVFNESAQAVQQTSDGGYVLAGQTATYGAGNYDAWLIKTDENGNKDWEYTIGGINRDYATAVKQVSDGSYILAGYTESYETAGGDAWIIKTEAP